MNLNPLFPNSNANGVQAGYEQAALMDDTKKMLAKQQAEQLRLLDGKKKRQKQRLL